MKIKTADIYLAKLPLKKAFKHGSFERTYNDTVFLALTDGQSIGWGESLPREYVTGESIDSVLDSLQKYLKNMPKTFNDLESISQFLDSCEPESSRNMAALCSLDMAMLDLYCKNIGKSLSDTLSPERKGKKPRVTSGPLSLTSPAWKKEFYCFVGVSDIKLKITSDTPPERINKIGKGIFRPRTLRLDGNCSLTPKYLERILDKVRVPIAYVEQPFPVSCPERSPRVKLMADESLVSVEDARKIDFDSASIRIGKNGGILRTQRVIKEWEKRGKNYMLGSLVGETSLLSAALLHLAYISNPFLVEGCYSTRLLLTDPVDTSPSVGFAARVKFDYSKPGLGVNLDLSKVESKIINIKP